MTDGIILENIATFIRNWLHNANVYIDRATLLENDLSITGEDAAEFIQDFGQYYLVNIDNFTFNKYFYEEPSAFFSQTKGIKPFTVNHLVKAVAAKRLNEDIFNE